MGTHPIFESDFDCLTEIEIGTKKRKSIKMDDMIGRTWAEWEESLADSDAAFGESEAEYADYRETVGRETPDLRLEHDIKSECSGVYETELVRCDWCGVAFKLCHLRHHVQLRHPEMPEMKYTPPTPTFDVTSMHRGTIKKEPTMASSRPTATTTTTSTSNDQFNNNLKVKKTGGISDDDNEHNGAYWWQRKHQTCEEGKRRA